ncbi:GCN5 family acetyltransferase [Rhizobium sp. Root274]|uniref:GNAT family N-acetyltransferase n=1 Tax=unclassified Rhizobium TaxID=2613769 RepID=UPI000712AB3E|nr:MULTISPECIES: GNAT family N-acetyltransferase [unclassified Rhizobium]KQW29574.1 GCN5 family acetyltransferase [Rhizobium sp. Root1240]KRD29766.1 GCN5 family acetyltransferase [Rhizobium sp. Root274]
MLGDPQVRVLTDAEVEELVGWAALEGWNPGQGDAAAFRAADPDGFIGCFVDGRFAAGISAVRYGAGFGFIGLYICHPEFRGRGLGRLVWDAGMAHLGDRVIGLDGVVEQQANYGKMGFAAAYDTVRWSIERMPVLSRADASCHAVGVADVADILAFDRSFFPGRRESFLTAWLKSPRQPFVCRRQGAVAGYAVVRPCRSGHKIGPLFAIDGRTAEDLLKVCLATLGGGEINLDVPDYQQGFRYLLERLGFKPGFKTARMYRGEPPSLQKAGVYAITTLELC